MTLLARCNKCEVLKAAEEFHKNPKNKNGLQYTCKACYRAWYQANRLRVIKQKQLHRWEDQRVRMASDARRADKRHGRESDIQAKQIVIPEFCPVTGEPMWHAVNAILPFSPCLIRIDKTLGFVRGNWQVVSGNAFITGGRNTRSLKVKKTSECGRDASPSDTP
jgi:hypothetical protein